MNQPPFKCFITCTTHPLLKIMNYALLIIKGGYETFCCNINGKYNLTLVFFGCNWHFVTRATLIDDINSKSHITELKSSRKYSTNHVILSQNYATSYLWTRERTRTYTHTHTHTHTHTYTHTHTHTRQKHTDTPHKSDFKKPGACLPQDGTRLV